MSASPSTAPQSPPPQWAQQRVKQEFLQLLHGNWRTYDKDRPLSSQRLPLGPFNWPRGRVASDKRPESFRLGHCRRLRDLKGRQLACAIDVALRQEFVDELNKQLPPPLNLEVESASLGFPERSHMTTENFELINKHQAAPSFNLRSHPLPSSTPDAHEAGQVAEGAGASAAFASAPAASELQQHEPPKALQKEHSASAVAPAAPAGGSFFIEYRGYPPKDPQTSQQPASAHSGRLLPSARIKLKDWASFSFTYDYQDKWDLVKRRSYCLICEVFYNSFGKTEHPCFKRTRSVPPKQPTTPNQQVPTIQPHARRTESATALPSDRPSDQQGQVVDESAAVRMADGFTEPITGLSRQATTCPPDDDAAGGDRPLDTQSQTSEPSNTMKMPPSESRQTDERQLNKIQKTPTRSHREGPPSVVLSRSSVKSVLTVTADDRLSDIREDDGDVVSVSDGVPDGITALSSRSTTDGDDQPPDPQVVVGSSLSSTECAALRSVLALAMLDECEFTLLYRASRDGAEYGDLLRCVGDTKGLVFLIRKDRYVFGVSMSAGIRLPDHPGGNNTYICNGWHFSLAGHFAEPTTAWGDRQTVRVAGRRGGLPVYGARLGIGGLSRCLWLGKGGAAAGSMCSCGQWIHIDDVPDGYVGVRESDEYGSALFGGSKSFMADEVEVIRVESLSLLSLKVIEGANFDALQSAALDRFLGPTIAGRLKLIYRASRDGPSYGDLLRCVNDASGLVFVIGKDKYVFGAFIRAGIRLPNDPRGNNTYICDVWHFSLAGHFIKGPTKMGDGWLPVHVAGREGRLPVHRAKLCIGGIGCSLDLGCEDGAPADMRSCRHWLPSRYVRDGYVGVREGEYGIARFGGSEFFMADEVEVLTVV